MGFLLLVPARPGAQRGHVTRVRARWSGRGLGLGARGPHLLRSRAQIQPHHAHLRGPWPGRHLYQRQTVPSPVTVSEMRQQGLTVKQREFKNTRYRSN